MLVTGYSMLDAGIINEKRKTKNEKRMFLFNLDIVIWSRTGGMEFVCLLVLVIWDLFFGICLSSTISPGFFPFLCDTFALPFTLFYFLFSIFFLPHMY